MPAFTLKPEYPIPGEQVEVTFTGLDSDTNFVEVFAISAPEKSSLHTRIEESTKERVRVHSGESSRSWIVKPDVGGVYTYTLTEQTITSPSLSGFHKDPGGAPSPVIVASTTLTLVVGQKLTHPLGTSKDFAELTLFVWNDTIRATTLEVHGIVTPAILNPSSVMAASAIEDTSVSGAVAVLIESTATTIVGNIATVFAGMRDDYQAHIANATHHNAADTTNTIGDGYTATTAPGAEDGINALFQAYAGHLSNIVTSPATAPHDLVDGSNGTVTGGAGQGAETKIAALADFYIAYSAHIANASIHNSADVTNTLTALPPLMNLHRYFFEALASQTPTTPTGQNSAVATLAQLAGFTEA